MCTAPRFGGCSAHSRLPVPRSSTVLPGLTAPRRKAFHAVTPARECRRLSELQPEGNQRPRGRLISSASAVDGGARHL